MNVTRGTAARLAAAAASGVLLAASRPPLDVGPLALVALVPLFLAWRDRPPRVAAGYAFVSGCVYHALLLWWAWYFGAIAIVPFVAALSAYWAAAGALIAFLRDRGLRAPWLAAAVWICADGLVARVPLGGFSWGEIGYAFHDVAPARAVAGVGGVTLVSFLAVAFNAALADAVVAGRTRARPDTWVRAAAGLVIVVAVTAGATVTRAEPPPSGRLRVAVLQGNDKNRDLTAAEERARYLPNSHFGLARRVRDRVDLIVFPESSMDDDPRTDPRLGSRLAGIARTHHAWVLANATVDAPPDGHEALNLDVLYRPSGTVEGTYAKRHLVPFGERVPWPWLRDVIGELSRVPRDYRPGRTPGLFDVAGHRVATVICFESAFGYQIRPLVHDGAQLIVLSTNNRSYRRSANTAQHVAIGQMRAAEMGRPVVHAAISGVSAIIDADGVVRARTGLFDRTVLEATIATTTGQTPYVRYGEWVMWGSAGAVGACVVLALVRRRRAPSVDSTPADGADARPPLVTVAPSRDRA